MKILVIFFSIFYFGLVAANSEKAVAAYRQGDYLLAEKLWQEGSTSDDFYNLGNTLVALGKYQEAIKSYDRSLSLNNKNEDAAYNKKLVLDFLNKKQQDNKKPENKSKAPKAKNQKEPTKPQKPKPLSEQEQKQKQLMQIVPDEPGGLLRQQFLREHYQRVTR